MTNSTIIIRKHFFDTMDEIYTQQPDGREFLPSVINNYISHPMFNHALYDRFARKFVIVQVRLLALPN
jgi:hypothetical protein